MRQNVPLETLEQEDRRLSDLDPARQAALVAIVEEEGEEPTGENCVAEVVNMSTEAGRFKVIQVSMPQSLLDAVTHYAKAREESRAVFISPSTSPP